MKRAITATLSFSPFSSFSNSFSLEFGLMRPNCPSSSAERGSRSSAARWSLLLTRASMAVWDGARLSLAAEQRERPHGRLRRRWDAATPAFSPHPPDAAWPPSDRRPAGNGRADAGRSEHRPRQPSFPCRRAPLSPPRRPSSLAAPPCRLLPRRSARAAGAPASSSPPTPLPLSSLLSPTATLCQATIAGACLLSGAREVKEPKAKKRTRERERENTGRIGKRGRNRKEKKRIRKGKREVAPTAGPTVLTHLGGTL